MGAAHRARGFVAGIGQSHCGRSRQWNAGDRAAGRCRNRQVAADRGMDKHSREPRRRRLRQPGKGVCQHTSLQHGRRSACQNGRPAAHRREAEYGAGAGGEMAHRGRRPSGSSQRSARTRRAERRVAGAQPVATAAAHRRSPAMAHTQAPAVGSFRAGARGYLPGGSREPAPVREFDPPAQGIAGADLRQLSAGFQTSMGAGRVVSGAPGRAAAKQRYARALPRPAGRRLLGAGNCRRAGSSCRRQPVLSRATGHHADR